MNVRTASVILEKPLGDEPDEEPGEQAVAEVEADQVPGLFDGQITLWDYVAAAPTSQRFPLLSHLEPFSVPGHGGAMLNLEAGQFFGLMTLDHIALAFSRNFDVAPRLIHFTCAPHLAALTAAVEVEPRPYEQELAPLERQLRERGRAATAAEMLAGVRDGLGFTWDQIARIFNVSRRAIHLWVAGGKMSASKEELLRAVYQVVRGLPGDTQEERRGAFMNPRGESDSHWAVLSQRGRRGSEINGPVLSAAQALGLGHVEVGVGADEAVPSER